MTTAAVVVVGSAETIVVTIAVTIAGMTARRRVMHEEVVVFSICDGEAMQVTEAAHHQPVVTKVTTQKPP